MKLHPFLLSMVLLAPGVQAAADVAIRLEHGEFRLTGVANLTEPARGWNSVFTVSTAPQGSPATGTPAMLGSYAIESGTLIFRPRFPLAEGVRYRAIYHPPGAPAVEKIFALSEPAAHPATKVTRVYPSADVLPANQLKLYLYFSAPMQRGGIWRHVHLLDASSRPVDLAFLEVDQELWDATNQRLTVLFDPGRIKRGVAPQRDIGPPIVEGKLYTLQIDRDLPDAHGQPLAETWRKQFRGGPSVRSAIDLKQWRISPPTAGSTGPVTIDFPRPLDYALLEHAIAIRGSAGPVPGAIAIDHQEQQWRFTPTTPWKPGPYELEIDTALEDLAGNRIGRPFDVDLSAPAPNRANPATAGLRFTVGTR